MKCPVAPHLLILATFLLVATQSTAMAQKLAHKSQTDSGSGYDDLRGAVLNWGYPDFGDFRIVIYNHKVKWLGVGGYFDGIARELVPQISKVSDDVYFLSWSTGSGGDNIVIDSSSGTVNAHLFDESGGLMVLHGTFAGMNSPKIVFPHAELTPAPEVGAKIEQNIKQKNLPPFMFDEAVSEASNDVAARNELAGQSLSYQTPEGTVKVQVDGDVTHVWEDDRAVGDFMTAVTKIAEGIYQISWINDKTSNFLVVNRNSGQVFDHIRPSGKRAEAIYQLNDGDRGAHLDESGSNTDKRAIETLINNYADAIHNLALASEVWDTSDKASFIQPRGHQHGWRAINGDFYQKTMGETFSKRRLTIDKSTMRIQVYGDAAWAEFYWTFDATMRKDNSTMQTKGRETQVFRHTKEGWRIVHVHYSGMPVSGEREGF